MKKCVEMIAQLDQEHAAQMRGRILGTKEQCLQTYSISAPIVGKKMILKFTLDHARELSMPLVTEFLRNAEAAIERADYITAIAFIRIARDCVLRIFSDSGFEWEELRMLTRTTLPAGNLENYLEIIRVAESATQQFSFWRAAFTPLQLPHRQAAWKRSKTVRSRVVEAT